MMLVICMMTASSLCAQTIQGRVTNADGQPVNDASLFVRELKMGTAADAEGYYSLHVVPGTYTCIFQSLGYETETRVITVQTGVAQHNITLRTKAYEISPVVISSNREDPAYSIMRRTIALAPYYLNQLSAYRAEVYLKGSLQIAKISKLVKRMVKDVTKNLREGETYVEETFSEVQFNAPRKYTHKVLKKTGSMPGNESGDVMQLVTYSVYDPVALQPVISPLSPGAFAHYRFSLEGFTEENGRIINKIRITPLHKGKQLLNGHIYIADNSWHVHSIDVSGEFILGISFRLRANYGEVGSNIWMPVSHRINIAASTLGNRGTFHYTSSIKYGQITENTTLRKPEALQIATQKQTSAQNTQPPPAAVAKNEAASRNADKIARIMEQDDLTNREAYRMARLMKKEADAEKQQSTSLDLTATIYDDYKLTVDSAATIRDTAFWARTRPIPLSTDELSSYHKRNLQLNASPPRRDTTSTRQRIATKNPLNRIPAKILVGGSLDLGKRRGTLIYRGINPSRLGYNTVDGLFVGQKLTWRKEFTDTQRESRLSVSPEIVWSASRNVLMWNAEAALTYAPMYRGTANLRIGKKSTDFAPDGIHPLENTLLSLIFRRNYLKLYESQYIEASNTIDIANGLQLTAGLRYDRRMPLENTSNFSLFYRHSRHYTDNIPLNEELTAPLIAHTHASFSISASYTPRYFYRIDRSNRKRMVKSAWPTLSASWQQAAGGIAGSSAPFSHISADLQQRFDVGLMQELGYAIGGGGFINRQNAMFPDFKHFGDEQTPLTITSITNKSFKLLEHYRFSTSGRYLEAHLYFSSPFLLLKYLPFFSDRMLWQEDFQLNYLHTEHTGHYTELGYTIGIIWKAGIFVGFNGANFRSVGLRLSLPVALIY